ncbi:MAG: 30S ribosomal protein S20 [Bacteroidota bacterium]
MATRINNQRKKELKNKSFLSNMKTKRRNYFLLVKKKDKILVEKNFQEMDKTLQKLKSKGILHKNKVSRILSRLAKYKEF